MGDCPRLVLLFAASSGGACVRRLHHGCLAVGVPVDSGWHYSAGSRPDCVEAVPGLVETKAAARDDSHCSAGFRLDYAKVVIASVQLRAAVQGDSG